MMGPLDETKISPSNTTTVPRPVRNLLELEVGDVVQWHIDDEEILVRKKVDDGVTGE
ncbi:AbrB/MazE/SpoVT family DNA-binding domain-containing protein [Halomarina ordinaria]|uniref:AbrB/MazE/SpoVT family DNA-binding domain-containing protein n=1 Tax=Halomarina ordinaria TaxID=3033939 RepID=A0ABD5UD72_9EURY